MSDIMQKAGYGAKAGETIAGNLARGGDGKFTNAGNASAAKPKPKAKAKGSARAAAAKARAEELARKKAEREQARMARLVERKQKAMERELARKKKAEEAAKKGGGGGGGKKDDKAKEAAKAAEQAKKEAEKAKKEAQRQREKRQQAAQQRRDKRDQARAQAAAAAQRAAEQQQRQQAQASRQQQARSDRQAAASQRRADAQAKQQATAQRQAQARAERQARQAQAEARRAAADARREAAAKARAERQKLMDARRAKLDAKREQMQAQLAERRAAAEARARAKFEAWQKDQGSTGKAKAKDAPPPAPTKTTAPPSTPPPAPTTAPMTPPADPAAPPAPPTKRRRGQASAPEQLATTKLAKALGDKEIVRWAQITKIDAEQRIVEGIASDETPDIQAGMYKGQYVAGDVVDADAIAAALPAYLEWGNIREMHQPSAVGVAVMAEIRERRLHLAAKIVDDAAWKKVVEGVYKGFSIGGNSEESEIIKIGNRPFRKITKLQLTEISLVDRPANPAARFTLWKGHDMPPVENEPAEVAGIAKAAADPTKAITMLQALRDEAELAGNLNAAQGYSLAIAAGLEAAGIAQPEEPAEDELSDEDMAEDAAEGEGLVGEDDPLALLDGMDDEEAVVAMAARIGSLQKAGRTFSGATMGHLQTMHDTLVKMTGGGLCKADAPIAQSAQPSDVQKAAPDLTAQLAALTERLAALEAQPAEGQAPLVRPVAVEKSLATKQEGDAKPRVIKAHRVEDLRRMAMTEPNPGLRADYARQLAEAEKAQA